ncbi:hypothetical protein FRC17_001607, partial [Serendipita sp. 399]
MAAQMDTQKYQGKENIIVSIDLGTTHSQCPYLAFKLVLLTANGWHVRMVTRWRGQPEAAGDSKIPTIVAYKEGRVVACGAEARDYMGDERYEFSRWFKLHLHPDSMKISDQPPEYGSSNNSSPTIEIPDLPTNVTLIRVYSDFMRYLFGGFRTFFEETTPNGAAIWKRLSSRMIIVMTIPSGWDTRQQGFLQRAAQDAGMVESLDDAALRMEFVTEGEASVHYVLSKINHRIWLKKGVMFAVTDAGGSTVDSTLYVCKEIEPKLVLEEVSASECIQAGGVFVDRAAHALITAKLANSKYEDPDCIDDIVHKYEQRTKRLFDGTQDSNVIEFGTRRDNDREFGIVQGKLTLTQLEVSMTFDAAVARSVESCFKLLKGRKVKHLLLVGGFGESPYLRSRLKEEFESKGTEVVTVEEPSKKAASEGAIIWYIKQMVAARIARLTIGMCLYTPFDPKNREHLERRHQAYISASGETNINSKFSVILKKGQHIPQDYSVKHYFSQEFVEKPQTLGDYTVNLLAWEGDGVPEWITDVKGNVLPQIRRLCTLKADFTPTISSLTRYTSKQGVQYWWGRWLVRCIYGGTKLQARLEWKDG